MAERRETRPTLEEDLSFRAPGAGRKGDTDRPDIDAKVLKQTRDHGDEYVSEEKMSSYHDVTRPWSRFRSRESWDYVGALPTARYFDTSKAWILGHEIFRDLEICQTLFTDNYFLDRSTIFRIYFH